MTSIFYLYHYKIAAEDEVIEIDADEKGEKLIGIFSSTAKAKEAIRHLVEMPGFRDWKDGFRIMEDELDAYGWEDGFISGDEA